MQRLLLLLALCLPLAVLAQKPKAKTYQYRVDLTALASDRIPVRLTVPPGSPEVVTFNIPQVVPGTYADFDMGRFIHNLKALDAKGTELPVEKTTVNTWQIKNAKRLTTITYEVEDTWDTSIKEQFVYEVAGTTWEKDSVYVLNNGPLFGYLNDWKRYTYDITVAKPQGFYGSSSLEAKRNTATEERFEVPNYMDLVDAPIMYTRPDTSWLQVGNTRVLVSVYSRTGKVKSKDLTQALTKTLTAQRDYLGGTMPVDKYAFLIYLNTQPMFFSGALEHSYSSFYALTEGEPAQVAEGIRQIAAHEFFHIVTPLTVHAEEIGDFDYIEPKMSQHLWMYEGATEYFSQHALVQGGLITTPQFLNTLRGKMLQNDRYNMASIPFTEMSRRILDADTNKLFGNVYAKGALISMCVDLKLRAASHGSYSLIKLMGDLGQTYGKDKSFRDPELFDEIARTAKLPELRAFFRKHVEGIEPLPLAEVLNLVGVTYQPSITERRASLGLGFSFNAEKQMLVVAAVTPNANNQALGIQRGDMIKSINGTALSMQNIRQEIGKLNAPEAGKPLELVLVRGDQEMPAKATIEAVEVQMPHSLTLNPNPTPEQAALRKNWLNQ